MQFFMKHLLYTMALGLLLIVPANAQKKEKDKEETKKDMASLVKGMTLDLGLLNTYFNEEGHLFFHIPAAVLDQDLLMVSRYVQIPANFNAYSNAGSKTSEQLIHFVKKANKIQLIQVSYSNIAKGKDPIYLSVVQNNFNPILAAFEIKSEEGAGYLIEVTDYFMDDSPGFNVVSSSDKSDYKMGGVDKKRSSIDRVASFPINTEVTHTLTYSTDKAPQGNRSETLSFQVNHSIIELPKDPMPIRYEDQRVGWFSLDKVNYSSEALKSDAYRIARRWRLEPSDMEAYKRGELVTPVKPIVYYLDPATPLKWRPYFRKGIEDWNSAFEKAGFKNAIMAKEAPSSEEDPDFSPEDARFSMVRYVASTTRNATGPSVSDPRTGEIIESDIIWYHNHLRSYRNRYLLETAAANPKARTLDTPEEEIGEMMRRVISHEIGHALGLPHNMKASSAYPVDSLRSGTFTQKMGIATTIMDYARFNYIAQPGDQNIRFVRQLGPYDNYAIEWGYRNFPGQSPEEVRETLKKWVDGYSTDPMYMFGSGGNDPNTQTENIGDDPIKASNYALLNLKIVGRNLKAWTLEDASTFNDLEELHGEFLEVYRRYIYHVLTMVGGVNETRLNNNQPGTPYVNVLNERQLAALDFLNQSLWKPQAWLIERAVVSTFASSGALEKVTDIQQGALKRILSVKKLNQMLSSQQTLAGAGLSVAALMDRLVLDIFKELSAPELSSRELQKNMIIQLLSLNEEKDLQPEIKGYIYQITQDLAAYLKKAQRTSDPILKAHYNYCLSLVTNS
jgi:hypothetical protein